METNNKPLVSVIVPAGNQAHTLPRAIESVLAQSYEPIETIVIDAGSSDGTWEAISPYLSKIRYFFSENGGVPGERNRGLAKARGDVVAFLHPEDVWKSDKIEKQVRKFDDGVYAACITDREIVDDDGCSLYRTRLRGTIVNDGLILRPYLQDMRGEHVWTMLMRKEAVDELGGFDETLAGAQDREFFMRLACRFGIALVPEPLVRMPRSRIPAGHRTGGVDDLVILGRLARVAPGFVRENARLVRKITARANREYAEELVEDCYHFEARRRLRESLSLRFTFRALLLYAKSILRDLLSVRYPRYRDRGCFDGR